MLLRSGPLVLAALGQMWLPPPGTWDPGVLVCERAPAGTSADAHGRNQATGDNQTLVGGFLMIDEDADKSISIIRG